MQKIEIKAARRTETGKGAAARLRHIGQIPAIAYGKQLQAEPLSVSPVELSQVFSSERGRNTVIELDIEGKEKLTVLLCDYQHHPISRAYLHADFLQIRLDLEVDVDVPLELTGKAPGVVLGGTLRQVYRRLPVRCLPEQIPVKIVQDVSSMGLDSHVATRDLALPEGVSVRLPPERTLIAIVKEKQPAEEEATPQAQAAAATAAKASIKPEAPAAEKK